MTPETPDYLPNRKEAAGIRFRAGLNVMMGIIYILLGAVVMYLRYFGTIELEALLAYFLGGLFVIYGIFRIWRGARDLKMLRMHRL
jgi:uncharacterized membrane protein HdeD (DUF308 family)